MSLSEYLLILSVYKPAECSTYKLPLALMEPSVIIPPLALISPATVSSIFAGFVVVPIVNVFIELEKNGANEAESTENVLAVAPVNVPADVNPSPAVKAAVVVPIVVDVNAFEPNSQDLSSQVSTSFIPPRTTHQRASGRRFVALRPFVILRGAMTLPSRVTTSCCVCLFVVALSTTISLASSEQCNPDGQNAAQIPASERYRGGLRSVPVATHGLPDRGLVQ